MDARLKPYLWERIERISDFTQASYTEVIEEALEKGLNWLRSKIRKELDPAFDWKEQAPVQIEYEPNPEIEQMIKIAKTRWIDDEE